MVTRVVGAIPLWGGGSVTPSEVRVTEIREAMSGDARATTGQPRVKNNRNIVLRGTRDATEGPRSFGLCCPRSTASEGFAHEWLVRTGAKLSGLVRRPDHNWQPYICRS